MVKEHGLLIFMPPELQMGLIKFQASLELGKSYAGLLLLTEGLYQAKCISEEVYHTFKKRYSRKLVDDEQTKLVNSEEFVRANRELQQMQDKFSLVISQWHIHDGVWRGKWLREAERWKSKVPNAKLVLDLGGK